MEMIYGIANIPSGGLAISDRDLAAFGEEQNNFWMSNEGGSTGGMAHALDALGMKIGRFYGKAVGIHLDANIFSNDDLTTAAKMWGALSRRFTPELVSKIEDQRLFLLEVFNRYHSANKGVRDIPRDSYDSWTEKAEKDFFELGKVCRKWFDYDEKKALLFIEKSQWDLRKRHGAYAQIFENTTDYETLVDILEKFSPEELSSLSLRSLKEFITNLVREDEKEQLERAQNILYRSKPLFELDSEDEYFYNDTQGWIYYFQKNYETSYSYYHKSLEGSQKSGYWDRRHTTTMSMVIRTGIYSQKNIDEYFPQYKLKSQMFSEMIARKSLNNQFLYLLQSNLQETESTLESKIESLLEDSEFTYSPREKADYYLDCAEDIFDCGAQKSNEIALKVLRKSLALYQKYGRWNKMITVLTLLIENETNEFLKPTDRDNLNKAKQNDIELKMLLDLSFEKTGEVQGIASEQLLENKKMLEEFYDASVQLNQTVNIEALKNRFKTGTYKDWKIVNDYIGPWGILYTMANAVGRKRNPQHYGENEIDLVSQLDTIVGVIGTPFAEAYALEKIASNIRIIPDERQLNLLLRLNVLLREQGAERLRYINLERIAKRYLYSGQVQIGEDFFTEIIKHWKKNYPQNAIYSTENYAEILLNLNKVDKALMVISDFKSTREKDTSKLISLLGLEANCYSRKGEKYWQKGILLIDPIKDLILEKKFVHWRNREKYDSVLGNYLILLQLTEDWENKRELISRLGDSELSISDVYLEAIKISKSLKHLFSLTTALYLEKIEFDFNNKYQNYGFTTFVEFLEHLYRKDFTNFKFQCMRLLDLGIKYEDVDAILDALQQMKKSRRSFPSENIQQKCSNHGDNIVFKKGDLFEQAEYLRAKSSWYEYEEKSAFLNSAFQLLIQDTEIKEASRCLQELFSVPPQIPELIRKLRFDVEHNLPTGSNRVIVLLENQIPQIHEKDLEEILLLLEEFLQKTELTGGSRLKIAGIKLKILTQNNNFEQAYSHMKENFNNFPFDDEAWHLGQGFLSDWDVVANKFDEENILPMLNEFIHKLETVNKVYWIDTALQAIELRKKYTIPEKSPFEVQTEIISELEQNPEKAVELLDTFIQNESDNPLLENHLKSILSKTKGTRIEEIILLRFIENTKDFKLLHTMTTRLVEYYRAIEMVDTSLDFINQLVSSAETDKQRKVALEYTIKMVKEVFAPHELAEKCFQILLGKTLQLHRIFISIIKKSFNEKDINRIFNILACRFLETRKYLESELYYKQLLMNAETDGDHHALYVYRLALCQIGRTDASKAIQLFHEYIQLEEDETTHKALRNNMGVLFIETGNENGYRVLSQLSNANEGKTLVGKGDTLAIKDEYLLGAHDNHKLKINLSKRDSIFAQIESYSNSINRRDGNDIYILILDENDTVIDVKLPAIQPLKLNFTRMYSNE